MPVTVWMTLPITTTFVDISTVRTTLVVYESVLSSLSQPDPPQSPGTRTSSLVGYRTTTSTTTSSPSELTNSATPTSQFILTSNTHRTSSFVTSTGNLQAISGSTTLTSAVASTPNSSPISADASTLQHQAAQERQKHVIIGSLCGVIAGLVVIGIAICFFLRRRRRRQRPNEQRPPSFHSEKRNSPKATHEGGNAMAQPQWSERTSRAAIPGFFHKSNLSATTNERSGSSMTVDEGHHIIRESIQRWPRPYARGESLRDSVPAGALRITNPDTTSSPPSIPCGYLKTRGSSGLKALIDRPKPAFIPGASQQDRNSSASTVFSHYSDGNSRASVRSTAFQQHPLAQQIRINSPSPASSSRSSVSPISSDERLDFDHSKNLPLSLSTDKEPRPISSGPSPIQRDAFLTAPLRLPQEKPSLASLRTVRQTPPEDPFYQPSATPISPDSVFQLSSPTWYSPPPTQPQDRQMFSPAGEHPSQTYREDNNSTINDRDGLFSQRSSRYSQISPIEPHDLPSQTGTPNWPLVSRPLFTNASNRSEDSLGDPITDRNFLAPPSLQPSSATSSVRQREHHWARRSDPFDLDRGSL